MIACLYMYGTCKTIFVHKKNSILHVRLDLIFFSEIRFKPTICCLFADNLKSTNTSA